MLPSPFYVIEDFISPFQCERFISLNASGKSQTIQKLNGGGIPLIENSFADHTESIQNRFNCILSESIDSTFIQLKENSTGGSTPPAIPGWMNSRKKWFRTENIDFVGIIPLKTFSSDVPMDTRFEVYGGKIEFQNFNFSILPERGSLILIPSAPNFIHSISPILFGTFEYIQILLSTTEPWVYNSELFSPEISAFLNQ